MVVAIVAAVSVPPQDRSDGLVTRREREGETVDLYTGWGERHCVGIKFVYSPPIFNFEFEKTLRIFLFFSLSKRSIVEINFIYPL